jgi:VWFA-related protein
VDRVIRRFFLLFSLISISFSAFAAKLVTVEQLEQLLVEAHGKPDVEVVRQLSDVSLTERLSAAKLSILKADPPGPMTVQALVALADASSFLDPPTAEIPPIPPPNTDAQRKMMSLAVQYVAKTIPQLPNFLATRVTVHFDDTPQSLAPTQRPAKLGFHAVGSSINEVTYRDGLETIDTGPTGGKKTQAKSGLTSWGEFGPILGTTLADSARGKIAWSHWEQRGSDQVAVFRYSVSKENSHYLIDYCCLTGYHGTISLDPATGTILRITVEADLIPTAPISRGDIMVEYQTVQIGGRDYICPSKSVAISETRASLSTHGVVASRLLLNDVAYKDYHRFDASARLISTEPPSAMSGHVSEAASTPPISTPAEALAIPTALSVAVPEAAPVAVGKVATAQPAQPVEGDIPEYMLLPIGGLPGVPIPENETVLKATARLVDVGLTAHDKHGRPVADLNQQDIEVYDNGKKQEIRYFVKAAPAGLSSQTAALAKTTPTNIFSNQPAIAAEAAGFVTPSATVLLIDEAHLGWPDLTFAKRETIKFLKRLDPYQPVALYIMDDVGFHVLMEMTEDHALLASRLEAWTPDVGAVGRAQRSDPTNSRHIDEVRNPLDMSTVNGSRAATPDVQTSGPPDPQLRDFGANPARESLRVLIAVARHLGPVTGHKDLIWVSGDAALLDWSDQASTTGPEKLKSKYLNEIASSASEALNEAHVAVYALDASAIEAGGVDASLQHRNVELTQAAKDLANLQTSATGSPGGSHVMTGEELGAGRVAESMKTDLHSIQGPIRQMAESTGGKAVPKASNLAGTLDGILSDSQATYLASFTPDSAPDGTFHKIILRAPGRQGITLRYRSGYLFEKESADPKAKFQGVVWRPIDPNQIVLTATVLSRSPAKIQIMIALKDLTMDERGDRWTGKVDVFMVQREEYGGQATSSGEAIRLELKRSTYWEMKSNGFAYQRSLTLQPKIGSVRAIVYDEGSGRIGSVTIPATAFQP